MYLLYSGAKYSKSLINFAIRETLYMTNKANNPNHNFVPLKGFENFEATTQIIIAEILKRNLPLDIIDENNNLIAVKSEGKEFIIHEGTISDANSIMAYWISNDKWMTKTFLKRAGINFAKAILLKKAFNHDELKTVKFPAVVKPVDTDHGIAVSTNIKSMLDLLDAIDKAFHHSNSVIIEDHFEGREYRFLVIDFKLRAIAYRVPANVVGDSKKQY